MVACMMTRPILPEALKLLIIQTNQGIGQTGRLNVEVHFSDTKMANDTKLVYEKLLNETVMY